MWKTSMRRPLLPLLLILMGLLALGISPVLGGGSNPGPATHIILFNDGVDHDTAVADLARSHGIIPEHIYRNALSGASAIVPPGRLDALLNDPRVALVEPNIRVQLSQQGIPDGIARVGVTVNSTANIDGFDDRVDVDIAIIDTGIDLDHPDLNVFASTNCARGGPRGGDCKDGEGNDGNGHGTHVAGTSAALDNGLGVVGVAPGARLWAVRVLDNRGSGWLSWIVAGIDYVDQHADEIEVANMSLGWEGNVASARIAIQSAVSKGVVFVTSAGNSSIDVYGADGVFGTSDDQEPASYPETVAVSAMGDTDGQAGGLGPNTAFYTTLDDTFASFTNFSNSVVAGSPVVSPGAAIDLAAPGVMVFSTYKDGGYATISGTSMSSPHVTGSVALHIAANDRASNSTGVANIRQALINGAQPQADWRLDGATNDPDSNAEGLVQVGPGVEPDPAVAIFLTTDKSSYITGQDTTALLTAVVTDEGNAPISGLVTGAFVTIVDGGVASVSFAETSTPGTYQATLDITGLSDGPHAASVTVTDSRDLSAEDSAAFDTGPAPQEPTAVSVDSISYATSGGKNGDKHLLITIALVDDFGNPVAGAAVTMEVEPDGSVVASGTGTTGANGTVTGNIKNAASGCYTTLVTNISADGLSWDQVSPDNQFCK